MSDQYTEFIDLARELADIGHAQALLGWDQETYMPAKGTARRARSLGVLAGIHHEKLTAPRLVGLVVELSDRGCEGEEAVNLRELKRVQDRALKIPKELVVELTETQSLAHEAWIEARSRSEFPLFAPWLVKVLDLQKQVAHRVGFQGTIYNAFLDVYEPYARTEDLVPVLEELRRRLVPLAEKILATGKRPAAGILDRSFPLAQQEAFGRRVMADMGFDSEAGRLDVSVHPFCSSLSREDVRLTTRYSEDQLTGSIFGTIHECGHGLYEQGLPEDAEGTPAGDSISLGIHESQSRMWENMVGRSHEFWEHYLPVLRQQYPDQLKEVDVDRFYAAVNQVEASPIRVEADEVTYNLHILLRFELERDLLEERLRVEDLPELWMDRMEAYLGIRPESDAVGVLQDVHWSLGLIGYFPTYTLGNLYAAQFFSRAQVEMPDLMDQVRQGQLLGLRQWLKKKIHQRGKRSTAGELVEEVTGELLRVDFLMEYLEGKFGELYDI